MRLWGYRFVCELRFGFFVFWGVVIVCWVVVVYGLCFVVAWSLEIVDDWGVGWVCWHVFGFVTCC